MKKTLLRFAGLLAMWLAAWAMPALAAESEFCWKDSYGRGVGTVPQSCDANSERLGLLCYSKCGPNMQRAGLDCHSVCPDGMRPDGLFCRAAEYGRGAGYPFKFGDAPTNAGMFSRCEADHGKGGCEQHLAIVYPKCKPGYEAFGCCICRPKPPNCAALGLNAFMDLSCAKRVVVGVPSLGTCAPGEQRDAGLCYKNCKPSYSGAGPVCWGQCPATHPVACGAGCAKTQDACASNTTDQVMSVLEVVANVGLAAATAGGSTAATAAGKAAVTGTKVATKGSTFAVKITKQEAIAIIKKQAKESGKDLSEAAVGVYAEALVQAGNTGEFDPQILAGLDPTGISGIVVAYAKPVCSAPSAGAAPTPTRGSGTFTATAATAPPAPAAATPQVISLRGAHGKFVVAEPDGRAYANRAAAGPWERFAMLSNADGTVSFRGAHGKYLVAEADGTVNANRNAVGPWEKFALIRNADGTVSFRSAHGKYLVAEPDGRLNANRAQIGPWETFRLQ